MPRRRVLTDAQLEGLLALSAAEPDLIRYWTLSPAEIAAIQRRRRDRNRLGFALQLCALRYPGRLLRSGECIPPPALRYVAHQLDADPEALAAYAARFQTRYEQLETLRETFGFNALERPQRRELLAWLLPVALTTTSAPTIAATLMDELRRRQIIVPGSSIIERMVATAVLLAERRVASQLTRDLRPEQVAALDALLQIKDGTPMSVLAWARLPPGAPRHRALARLVEQLACLRTVVG
jgi:TnpA family transposase